MPFRLAVLNSDLANQFYDKYDVEHWYLAGHSLGGAMAASHMAKTTNGYEGLILLAAYSTKDLSNLNLDVYLLYGENDQIMNKDKYNACKKNLPSTTKEYVIDGGCHAYFGMYGKQLKDQDASITNEEQIQITVDFILSNIKKRSC